LAAAGWEAAGRAADGWAALCAGRAALLRAGAEGLAAEWAGALGFDTRSLAFSVRESTDVAVTGTASTAVSATAKAERRVASGVIKLALDFINCSPFL
jgi:hypothetical protein